MSYGINLRIPRTWDWKALGPPPPPPSPPMDRRVKAVIQAAVMVAVGVTFRVWKGHVIGPAVIWSLAALVLVGGLFYPPLFRAIERFGLRLAHAVGFVLTWGLLAPFFFLVFVPARVILALRRADPMARALDRTATSYFIPRPPVEPRQYTRQH